MWLIIPAMVAAARARQDDTKQDDEPVDFEMPRWYNVTLLLVGLALLAGFLFSDRVLSPAWVLLLGGAVGLNIIVTNVIIITRVSKKS